MNTRRGACAAMRERLIELRKYFQMSQREFCSRFSMVQATYAPLETGKRPIRDTYVQLICQAYNVNPDWLRYGTEPMLNDLPPNRELEELLNVYDNLSPALQKYLLKNARDLKELQGELDRTN